MPVVPPGDFAALKQFLINSEVRIRSLESLGVPRESLATPFVSFLVDRLPKNIRTAWYRLISDKEETSEVVDILAFLRREVVSHERSQISGATERKRGALEGSLDHPESKKARMIPTASALTTSTKAGNMGNYKNECCFCRGAHPAAKWEMPLQKRFEVAKKERLCFICLRKGHQAAKCGNPNPNCRHAIAITQPCVEKQRKTTKTSLPLLQVAAPLPVLSHFLRSKMSILKLQPFLFMVQRED